MKIVHVFKDYYPPTRGGVEQHLHDVVHSLEGFEFEVLTAARSRRTSVGPDNGVPVRRSAELGRISTSPVTPGWLTMFRRSDADAFHFHMPNPFGELALLAAQRSTPIVATYHADIVGRRVLRPGFAPIQARFLRRADRIIVTSPSMLEARSVTAHRDRVIVIPFGADARRWSARPPLADELRAQYSTPIVLFLGRLVEYKGVETLIEAMRNLEATLLVVGDGPKRHALERVAEVVGNRNRTVFVGEIPDHERAAYYHAADLFVLPSTSRAEAFGIATLEALACGTPAVTTDLGTGTSFVNVADETGVVVPPGSPGDLAAAIGALLADDQRRTRFGRAGRQRASAHFSKQAMLDRLAAVYRSL